MHRRLQPQEPLPCNDGHATKQRRKCSKVTNEQRLSHERRVETLAKGCSFPLATISSRPSTALEQQSTTCRNARDASPRARWLCGAQNAIAAARTASMRKRGGQNVTSHGTTAMRPHHHRQRRYGLVAANEWRCRCTSETRARGSACRPRALRVEKGMRSGAVDVPNDETAAESLQQALDEEQRRQLQRQTQRRRSHFHAPRSSLSQRREDA